MNLKVGMKLTVTKGQSGYPPHFVRDQIYTVARVNGGRFYLDRCSGSPSCQCTDVGWLWSDQFDFYRPPLKPGDKIEWVAIQSTHFIKGVQYTVRNVVDMLHSMGHQQFTVVECHQMKIGYRCECGEGRAWVFNKDFMLIESEIVFTEEEIKKAPALPSPTDVASFFGVKL